MKSVLSSAIRVTLWADRGFTRPDHARALQTGMATVVHEDKLSAVLSEFARTLATDFPIQSILDHLVERIVEILPVTAAGVTLISGRTPPQYVAASDRSALRFEQLQTELGQGPCLSAYQAGEAVSVPNLEYDDRFPEFGPAALG